MIRRLTIGIVVAVMMLPALVAQLAQPEATEAKQGGCEIILGFKLIRDMIPQIVGECRENEWHNAFNGDGLQQTTGGLLVWRKCDNWTAFTNGSTTWINGPNGLVTRPNEGPFFPFEATDCPPVQTGPAPGPAPAPAPAPAPTGDARPSVRLELSDDRVNRGEEFTIRLEATDDRGVASMWWWATDTDDDNLRNTHTFDCNGATPCRNSWQESTNDDRRMVIHAMSRDTAGQQSDEVTLELRVREGPTPTPTPTATPTPVAPPKG